MPQVRRCLQWPKISGIVKTRDLSRSVRRFVNLEPLALGIRSMTEHPRLIGSSFAQDLTDPKLATREPLRERVLLRRLPRSFAHLKACPIISATRSRTSRSSFENAFSFSLSAVMTPTTLSDLLMIGTTISDSVLWNVGK